ncbi:MAG TPA: phosphate-starvation-inducible PsiE family protein [Lysobacter sp.]|jgi:uncharacterized membrane protein (DUF373 family)
MKDLWPKEAFTRGFEHWVVSAVQVLLMVMIVLGLLDLVYLLFRGARSDLLNIQTEGQLQRAMQQGFAGILLVLIGLELLETVRAYLKSHRIRLEVVLIVAVIALGRHIVELELEDVDGLTLVGIAALIAALVGGYYLARRLRADTALASTTPSREEIKQ